MLVVIILTLHPWIRSYCTYNSDLYSDLSAQKTVCSGAESLEAVLQDNVDVVGQDAWMEVAGMRMAGFWSHINCRLIVHSIRIDWIPRINFIVTVIKL